MLLLVVVEVVLVFFSPSSYSYSPSLLHVSQVMMFLLFFGACSLQCVSLSCVCLLCSFSSLTFAGSLVQSNQVKEWVSKRVLLTELIQSHFITQPVQLWRTRQSVKSMTRGQIRFNTHAHCTLHMEKGARWSMVHCGSCFASTKREMVC